jgi:hypothetical protein
MNGEMPRTLPEPADTERIRSRQRPHDPQQRLITTQACRSPLPPATDPSRSHPVPWTVDLATSADMHTRGRTLRHARLDRVEDVAHRSRLEARRAGPRRLLFGDFARNASSNSVSRWTRPSPSTA